MSEKSDAYRQLAETLTRRLEIIADRKSYQQNPTAHLAQLEAISEEIAKIACQLPAAIDPQLAHYLQRCSYDKALAFLKPR